MGTDLVSDFSGTGWDYFLCFWRNHSGISHVDSTNLAYLVMNISLNLNCSTSSVLFRRIWAEINPYEGHWVVRRFFGFGWFFGVFDWFVFILPLYRLSQQSYSLSLMATSWAFKTLLVPLTHIWTFLHTLFGLFYHLWNAFW